MAIFNIMYVYVHFRFGQFSPSNTDEGIGLVVWTSIPWYDLLLRIFITPCKDSLYVQMVGLHKILIRKLKILDVRLLSHTDFAVRVEIDYLDNYRVFQSLNPVIFVTNCLW